jgi:hypothetical protein
MRGADDRASGLANRRRERSAAGGGTVRRDIGAGAQTLRESHISRARALVLVSARGIVEKRDRAPDVRLERVEVRP